MELKGFKHSKGTWSASYSKCLLSITSEYSYLQTFNAGIIIILLAIMQSICEPVAFTYINTK
jgi:hypothetical protein